MVSNVFFEDWVQVFADNSSTPLSVLWQLIKKDIHKYMAVYMSSELDQTV